jgi:uncharacterized damage-inducible protein DinB
LLNSALKVITVVEVKQLLQYNELIRHRYFEALAKLPWSEFVKNREASFHSLRNIFIHTLGAIDYWLDFLQNEHAHSHKKFDDYKTIEDVKTYMDQVENRMHKYLDSLPPNGLQKKYEIKHASGETEEVMAEDILIHVFEEEVHHRGEIIALLWQMGVEPPPMGWERL